MYVPGDWIRDVGAATNELPAPARWWSLTMDERLGRRRALRRVQRTLALVVEVLSPTTRRVDFGTKLLAYEGAGVPSYEAWEGSTPFAVRVVPGELVR